MLYQNIRIKRERIGIAQKDIAKILNIDYKTYSHYENEDVIIPLKHLITICNYYDISLDYAFNFTQTPQYPQNKTNVNPIEVGKRLKEFRKTNKLTQANLANIINVARSIIGEYENGHFLISTHSLYTICKDYNISADYLLGKTNNPKYFK